MYPSSPASETGIADMLIDSSIDAVIAIANDWTIIAWNHTAEVVYGIEKEQALGSPLLQAIPALAADAETLEAIDMALKGFKSFVPASRDHANRLHTENHFIPLKNKEEIRGVMNLIHDVTHRLKAEQKLQLLNNQLKRTLDELASYTYETSSNIKAPIRNIYTAVEHLIRAEAGQLTDSGKAAFRRIQSSINRMDLLLNDMLGLSQISIEHKPEHPVNLTRLLPVVTESIKDKLAERNAEVVLMELCTVTGHEEQLRLLFYHLLDNALKFNDSPAPRIVVDCVKTAVDDFEYGAFEDYYQVTISDNGIGVHPADAENIFNVFKKLHAPGTYKGSGMGLAIARKIMDVHNGFIKVESQPGAGSSFHCFFPAGIPVS